MLKQNVFFFKPISLQPPPKKTMRENSLYDKKSLKLVTGRSANWKAIALDCVAFANACGGTIALGIEDDSNVPCPNQRIPHELVEKINKAIPEHTMNVHVVGEKSIAENGGEYIRLQVFRSAQSIAGTSDGRYAIRVSDSSVPILPDEIARLAAEKNSFVWESQISKRIPRNAYDRIKCLDFLNDISRSDRVSQFVKSKNPEEILDYYHFASGDYLTNLGVLWIGNRQQRATLVHAPVVQFTKYDKDERKTLKRVWDDHSKNPKEMIEAVLGEIPDWDEGTEIARGAFRTLVPNYERSIIRELVANALVHRPYTMRGDIFLNLFPDRLEIHNPGLLPLGVTPANILHTSIKRNELLASVFYALGLMEREGSGYDMMYERLLSQAKEVPVVEEGNDRVMVTIKRRIIKEEIIEFVQKADEAYQLRQKEMISLGLVAQHGSLSALEFSKILGVDKRERIRHWMGRLQEYGLVSGKGKTRGMAYFIPDGILRSMSFKGKTTLKRIEDHRLMELVRKDLELYPESGIARIGERIGLEIPQYRIRKILKALIRRKAVAARGSKRWTTYSLNEDLGK